MAGVLYRVGMCNRSDHGSNDYKLCLEAWNALVRPNNKVLKKHIKILLATILGFNQDEAKERTEQTYQTRSFSIVSQQRKADHSFGPVSCRSEQSLNKTLQTLIDLSLSHSHSDHSSSASLSSCDMDELRHFRFFQFSDEMTRKEAQYVRHRFRSWKVNWSSNSKRREQALKMPCYR